MDRPQAEYPEIYLPIVMLTFDLLAPKKPELCSYRNAVWNS